MKENLREESSPVPLRKPGWLGLPRESISIWLSLNKILSKSCNFDCRYAASEVVYVVQGLMKFRCGDSLRRVVVFRWDTCKPFTNLDRLPMAT